VAWVFRQAWRTPSLLDSALAPVAAWLVELARTDAGARAHNQHSNGDRQQGHAERSRDGAAPKTPSRD
jgi:hypothetical protein